MTELRQRGGETTPDTLPERRGFERTPLDLEIEVVSHDHEGIWCMEKTILEDISGEGARFLTRNPHTYYRGQSLEVMISLPGTDELKAWMKGSATVVRIGPCSSEATSGQSQPVCVAIRLDAPLQFERDEREP